MPLTPKGNKIMADMKSEYGAKKGKSVFYASRNAGKITGVDPESSRAPHKHHTVHQTGAAHPDHDGHSTHAKDHLKKAGY
jgi:hypothetical protein